MLVHDIKERPLLHLFEGGKFAAKKIKVTVDKRGEGLDLVTFLTDTIKIDYLFLALKNKSFARKAL